MPTSTIRALPALLVLTAIAAGCDRSSEPAASIPSELAADGEDVCSGLDEAGCDAEARCEATYRSGPMTDTGTESFLYDSCILRPR
jgi:hypothetical protein